MDGLFSGYIACKFATGVLKKEFQYFINTRREHGFKLPLSSLRGYLMIAVDFDIDRKTAQGLVDNDCAFVSLDHHAIKDDLVHVKSATAEGVIINNQYYFEPEENRYNSGAGITYEGLCEMYPDFESQELEAIVGITLLSDARPIENERARKYLTKTYKQDCSKGYFKYLLENTNRSNYGFGVPRFDRNYIDFTFSPCINSLLRFGMEEETINFILGKGLCDVDTKKRQQELLKKMSERASILRLSSLTVAAVNKNDFLDIGDIQLEPFIGALCSQIKNKGGNAIAFVIDNGKITRASFRGKYDGVHYDLGFINMGIDARGHKNAFGIVNFQPTAQTWQEINDLCEQLDEGHEITSKIIETSNIATVLNTRGYNIATENCYVRDEFRTYLHYTGKNIVLGRESGKYIEYLVDGRRIKCFDKELTVSNSLILPMLEKGHVQLYLRPMIE